MKHIIIYGSSGNESGTTWKAIQELQTITKAKIVNLSNEDISFYDYQHHNKGDGFKDIIESVVAHDHITFATPVYWYSMSAQLKTFFDRLTDLITIRKQTGRALKGKTTSLLATGYQPELPEGFILPFKSTSEYFDMIYKSHLYINKEMSKSLNTAQSQAWFQEFINSLK